MRVTRMSALPACAALSILAVLVLGADASPVRATGSTVLAGETAAYAVEVLVDGRPLPQWPARGRRYVEASYGRDYAIRLSNRTSRRAAVALAVDGVNTIDARSTSAQDARKWLVPAFGSIVIEGWQTNAHTARQFYFTTEEHAYAEWLGRPRAIGLISAAFFPERVAQIVRPQEPETFGETPGDAASAAGDAASAAGDAASAPGDAASAAGDTAARGDARAPSGSRTEAAPGSDGGYAGTGSGRRVGHEVREVALDLEPAPAAVLVLRYEFREALVRLGVLPRGEEDVLARREGAGAWSGWCPDLGR